ncbi:MAG: DUF4358 domain-containing protein [Oscillospiraceae bacterium]|jgi:hypothetical protein|nr:DUF4358 domain-containing protein [Oscillospiraceae bacterium]
MNFKRISAAALASVLAATLVPAALADERPEGWTPADGARIVPISAPVDGMLISPNPNAGSYDKVITVNGETLEGYEYDREVPGWGSETVSVKLSEIPTAPIGYLPLRAVLQADHGSAYWDSYSYTSSFYYGEDMIVADFNDMSISVNDEKVEGAQALLVEGVTYVPFSVLEKLEGVTVTDSSTDAGESYEIITPNNAPLMKLAYQLMETAGMGMGMKSTPAEVEEAWSEAYGFKADMVPEGVFFLGMMTTPDTVILGKVAEGKTEELQAVLEAYRKQQEETFTWYLSHNLPKVENAKFVVEGDWFLFLIAENADEAVTLFQENVKTLGE